MRYGMLQNIVHRSKQMHRPWKETNKEKEGEIGTNM
jgi:hypothetical protein